MPQDHLEGVLEAHLAAAGVGRVLRGAELTGFTQRADGIAATVRTAVGDRAVVARYLVAADGSRSAIRGALGIAMHGSDDVLGAVSALIRAPLWAGARPAPVRHLRDRRARGRRDLPAVGRRATAGASDRGTRRTPTAARCRRRGEIAARVRRGAGMPGLPVEVERIGSFSSSARLAERFREGSAFLVGDAAHLVTPRGGTGMNTAFHDGHDLGWRLAWALKGWAGDDLLDGYERERRPVAEHNVARSADPDGSARPVGEELRTRPRRTDRPPLDRHGRPPAPPRSTWSVRA